MLAITHLPSPRMHLGERTFVEHTSIDRVETLRQHAAYREKLEDLGVSVRALSTNLELPDCAFIEDCAIVLDEIAILASMGTASRAAEPAGIEAALTGIREVKRVGPPATLEGGDVLRVDRTLMVGLSSRTNRAGVTALERIVRRHGYRVVGVPVSGCLHLKTACTALPDGRLLVNPAWLDAKALDEFTKITVPVQEPWAANTLLIGDRVLIPSHHPQTAKTLRRDGLSVDTVEILEFAKAEGGVTCLSILAQ